MLLFKNTECDLKDLILAFKFKKGESGPCYGIRIMVGFSKDE